MSKLSYTNALLLILSKQYKGMSKYQAMVALERYNLWLTEAVVAVTLSKMASDGLVHSEKEVCVCCGHPTGYYRLTDEGKIKARWVNPLVLDDSLIKSDLQGLE